MSEESMWFIVGFVLAMIFPPIWVILFFIFCMD